MNFKSLVRAQDPSSTKAIGYHPALVDAPNDPVVINGPARMRTPFGQVDAGRHLQAYGGRHDAIDWVMNCVRLIVETAANADWHFEKDGVKYVVSKDQDSPKEIKEAPYLLGKLFTEPNPYMNYMELIELTLIDYLLTGNAYWMKWRTTDTGQPIAIYRLSPRHVKVVPGPFGIEEYQYSIPGMDPITMTPDKIMHFRAPNPHSPYYGLGVIAGGSRMLDLELALTDTQASYYEKRAQPSMVVQSDRRVPDHVFKRLKDQLRGMYSGPRNAGALMVLEAGLKYQAISPSAADAQFQALTEQSRDRILAMFRVPGALLGINDGGQNQQNYQRVFDQKTMRPLLNKLQWAISAGITKAWDLEFKIDYDYIMPIEDRIRLASTFAALPGIKVKEVREYAGLDPLGDETDELILNLPGENGTEEDTHAGIPDNGQVNEQGRPPNPENTAAFPKPGESLPEGAAVRRPSLASNRSIKTMEDIIQDFKLLEASRDRKALEPARTDFRSRVTPPSDVLQEDRETAIDNIVASTIEDLNNAIHALERGLLDEAEKAVEGKAPGDRIRSRIRKSEAWQGFMNALTAALQAAAKTAISTSVMQQTRLGITPTDDIDYDSLAREVLFRTGGIRKIHSNFKNDVAANIGKALEEGGTKVDIERAIRESMDKWRDGHAELIALTEATHAYNEGVLTAAESAGEEFVFVHDGDEHDEPCIDANGSVWDIDTARANRIEHPKCRRAFSPVTLDEVG